MNRDEQHEAACDCGHEHSAESASSTWLSALMVCAVCPACLSMYAKYFAVLGVGAGLSARHEHFLLAIALTYSIGTSLFRSIRLQRVWPFLVSLLGSAFVVMGHLLHEGLEAVGILVLLFGGLAEQKVFDAKRKNSVRITKHRRLAPLQKNKNVSTPMGAGSNRR